MSGLYRQWCRSKKNVNGNKVLRYLTERKSGRSIVLRQLSDRARDHYISNKEITEYVDALGFPKAAESVRELLPKTPRERSGELGEILAAEFVEEKLGYDVPVKKLRYKDHRNMPMRGDDMIAVAHNKKKQIRILKGEAKSARKLSKNIVEKARERLEENHGRPSAHSLNFIARRLMDDENPMRKNLGKDILKEAANRSMPKKQIAHLLFVLCGNQVKEIVRKDFDAADGERRQFSVNLRIENHGKFVSDVYEEVSSIGNS